MWQRTNRGRRSATRFFKIAVQQMYAAAPSYNLGERTREAGQYKKGSQRFFNEVRLRLRVYLGSNEGSQLLDDLWSRGDYLYYFLVVYRFKRKGAECSEGTFGITYYIDY
jgi:hypothetical protein